MGLHLSQGYQEALDALFARTTGQWRLGLERIERFLEVIGNPHHRLRALHVAGTNGKGSVCATLDTVLRARGLRVARYTSPHLVNFSERFLVNGAPVPDAAVHEFLLRWTPTVERLGVTFFEATTAMAFELFAAAEVDIAVIETGLGGRLDATNVIRPLVAGVTSIGIDHVEWLGATRELIAPEKAGIFKSGVPAVVGEPDPAIRALLASEASRLGATPIRIVAEEGVIEEVRVSGAGTTFDWRRAGGTLAVQTPLPGRHQASNAAVALTMLESLPPELRMPAEEALPAMGGVQLPGRFSRHGQWIFDVAHNPDGAAVSALTLGSVGPERPVCALVSVLADKDWRGIMLALAPAVDRFVLTSAPSAPTSRAWDPRDALDFAEAQGWEAELEPDFERALRRAPALGRTVLVTGSFHTVGDAMSRLQVSPTTG